jgi:hypothetical protein
VALQGTIETFALPDVLRLLATTKKTGRLRLDGDRGSGSVWLDGGAIVASEASGAPHADGANDVVFELLRYADGDFVFNDKEEAAAPEGSADVESVLGEAEALLAEWQTIEAVVPSLGHWVSLAPDLPGDEVTLSKAEWSTLVAVGGGITVGGLGDALSLGELPVSRTVKELIERDLVVLRAEAPAGAVAPAPAAAPVAEPAPVPEPEPDVAALAEVDEVDTSFEPIVEFETVVVEDRPVLEVVPTYDDAHEPFDPGGLVIEEVDHVVEPEPAPAPAPAPTPAPRAAEPEPDAAEIARQLANLSPKAAKAVAAAAKATTEEERMAALAEVDETEDGLNRDLLLRFLGSMNS